MSGSLFFAEVHTAYRWTSKMDDRVTLTIAEKDDEDVLVDLMPEFYRAEELAFDDTVVRRALGELWIQPSLGRVVIAWLGDIPVGYMVIGFGFSLEYRGRDALVDELYVIESLRGRGVGTALLQRAETLCREEGIHALHLEVDRRNAGAKRLYHRAGYLDHDRYLLTQWLSD